MTFPVDWLFFCKPRKKVLEDGFCKVRKQIITIVVFVHLPHMPPPEATDQGVGGGGQRELKSVPFISYLSALQKSQLLTDDMVSGVEIRCEEKGSCPAGCHLCHHQAMMGGVSGRGHGGSSHNGEQHPPVPVLLDVSRAVPLYSLVQDNITKEVRMTITVEKECH